MVNKGKFLTSLFGPLAATLLLGTALSAQTAGSAPPQQDPDDSSGSRIIIISPGVQDLKCPAAKQVAGKFQQAAYQGVASAYTDDDRLFVVLADKDGKNWVHLYEERPGSGTACTAGEGTSMQTAESTGRLLKASLKPSAPARSPVLQPASLTVRPRRVSAGDSPFDEQGCGETREVLSYLNDAGEAPVFKGITDGGTIVRITAGNDKDGAGWTLISSFPDDSISCVRRTGDNFRFAPAFTPPRKTLE